MFNEFTADQFSAELDNGAYAWPGGYPKYLLMSDCETMCFDCAEDHRSMMRRAIRTKDRSGWRAIGVDINWEDEHMLCCHCNQPIQSAYGDGHENDC